MAEVDYLLETARRSIDSGSFAEAEAALSSLLERKPVSAPVLADACALLGALDFARGDYGGALERYSKSLDLAEAAGRPDLAALALNSVGELLSAYGEHREALSFFQRAAEALSDEDVSGSLAPQAGAAALYNIGRSLLVLGQDVEAVGYLELSLERSESLASPVLEARSCAALSQILRRRLEAGKSEALLARGEEAAARSGDALVSSELAAARGAFELERGRPAEALAALDAAESRALSAGAGRLLPDLWLYRSRAREALGDQAGALEDFKRFHQADRSLSDERLDRLVLSADARRQADVARKDAELQRRRNEELKAKRKELELTNARLLAVSEIARDVTSSLDGAQVGRVVYERLADLMDVEDFRLGRLDRARGAMEFFLALSRGAPLDPYEVPVGAEGCFGPLLEKGGQALLIAEYSDSFPVFGPDCSGGGAAIVAPLFSERAVVGVLAVRSRRSGVYGDEDLKLVSALSSFVAVALENSRIHAELARVHGTLKSEKAELERLTKRVSHLANHDGLTGLPNRLLLSELLGSAIERARRAKRSVAVMYLDLDDFKPINDNYGHLAGDEALVQVARRLKRALRASDTVARVGGDEFIAIASDLDGEAGAAAIASKLIEACRAPLALDGADCRVGVSVGVSLYPRDGKSSEDLLRRADEALYKVKRGTKNAYGFFGE